jgi:hypothetical protein
MTVDEINAYVRALSELPPIAGAYLYEPKK